MDRGRLLRLVAALAILATTVSVPATALGAQRDSRRALTLVDQTTWLRADQPFVVRLRIDSRRPLRDQELALTVFGRVPFRSQFAQTIDGRLLGSVLAHETIPVPDADRATDGTLSAEVTAPLSQAGVYPVRIELRDPDEEGPVARLTTHLVHVPDAEYHGPLQVTPVIPLDASPAIDTTGEPQIPASRIAAFTELGEALANHPGVAATLVPSGGTLDALASDAAGTSGSDRQDALRALGAAVSRRLVLPGTYTPVDVAALLAAGLDREADAQLARGRQAVERRLDGPVDDATWFSPAPLDADAVEWLRDRGYERFVVGDDGLEAARLSTTLTAPFELAIADEDRPLAASIDPGLTAHFDAAEQPAIAAHRLLADLAVIYFDHPGRAGRGIVVTPPRDWQPAPEFLDALLAGLAASPILTTATIEDYFADVEPATSDGRPLVRRMAADTAERGVPTRRIKEARRRLDSFQTLLAATTDRQFVFEHLLFAAQAVDLARRRQLGYLDGLRDAIDAELALVEIPERQTIRLTARQGDIPIPILSRTGYPVRVLIRVDSDTLDFPRGEEHLVTLDHETTTERVPVRARSSGAFPLRVTVLSPDAQLAISASRLTVTSTAASWVGIALSAGAAMFLAVWWARHVHGRRSGKLMPP